MSGEGNRPGITRLDQPVAHTHGWQVRLQRKGVRFGRFFSDSAWGGREAALERAIQFRDRLLAGLARKGADLTASSGSHSLPAARNQSGVVGVARIVQRSAKGVEYHFWQASWTTPDGRRVAVRYSVLLHGDEEALFLACEARRRATGSN